MSTRTRRSLQGLAQLRPPQLSLQPRPRQGQPAPGHRRVVQRLLLHAGGAGRAWTRIARYARHVRPRRAHRRRVSTARWAGSSRPRPGTRVDRPAFPHRVHAQRGHRPGQRQGDADPDRQPLRGHRQRRDALPAADRRAHRDQRRDSSCSASPRGSGAGWRSGPRPWRDPRGAARAWSATRTAPPTSARLEAFAVSGKTGTAQVSAPRQEGQDDLARRTTPGSRPTPQRRPQIAVAVLIEHGGRAAKVAAPGGDGDHPGLLQLRRARRRVRPASGPATEASGGSP